MSKVIFRKWRKAGTVIALFPDDIRNRAKYEITSYEHVGQHSGADYDTVMSATTPATETEYADLLSELKAVGYDDLQVVKQCKPKFK